MVLLGLVFCYCLGGPIQGVNAAPSFEEASSAAIDVSTLLTCTETDALCGPIPVNCSYGDRGEQWVEFTQELNYTQVRGVILLNHHDILSCLVRKKYKVVEFCDAH